MVKLGTIFVMLSLTVVVFIGVGVWYDSQNAVANVKLLTEKIDLLDSAKIVETCLVSDDGYIREYDLTNNFKAMSFNQIIDYCKRKNLYILILSGAKIVDLETKEEWDFGFDEGSSKQSDIFVEIRYDSDEGEMIHVGKLYTNLKE